MTKDLEKEKFNAVAYRNKWNKENLKVVSVSYKSNFVNEFKEACKKLGVSQSQLFRKVMEDTIDKAKEAQKND